METNHGESADTNEGEAVTFVSSMLRAPQLFATAAEIDALDMWSDTGAYLADVWDAAPDMALMDSDLYNNCSGELFQEHSGAQLRGVDTVFEAVPDDTTCYICLEPITPNDQSNVQKLSCNHWFHAKCLLPWALKKDTCPTCRSKHVPTF